MCIRDSPSSSSSSDDARWDGGSVRAGGAGGRGVGARRGGRDQGAAAPLGGHQDCNPHLHSAHVRAFFFSIVFCVVSSCVFSARRAPGLTPRNPGQETAVSAQSVPGTRFLVFDFGA
eukprot:3589943-Rhodomonas_salina.1